ncbi:10942_t:CDS:2, partial [Ambispora gerdemannii]
MSWILARHPPIKGSLRRLGAHHAVDLPTVVFCDNRSAGKSSLLEAISSYSSPSLIIKTEYNE